MQSLVKNLYNHQIPRVQLLMQYVVSDTDTRRFAISSSEDVESIPPSDFCSATDSDRDGGGATVAEYLKYAANKYRSDHFGLVFLAVDGIAPVGIDILIPPALKIIDIVRKLLTSIGKRESIRLDAAELKLKQRLADRTTRSNFSSHNRTLRIDSLARHLALLARETCVQPDLIVLDACSMAAVETVYELRKVTKWVIASPSDLQRQTSAIYRKWIENFSKFATLDPSTVATSTLNSLFDDDAARASPRGRLLLASTASIDQLAKSTKTLGETIVQDWNEATKQMVTASRATCRLYDLRMCHLRSFVTKLAESDKVPKSIKAACEAVDRDFKLVVQESLDPSPCGNAGECQLTVYFPRKGDTEQAGYDKLAFAKDHPEWMTFISKFTS